MPQTTPEDTRFCPLCGMSLPTTEDVCISCGENQSRIEVSSWYLAAALSLLCFSSQNAAVAWLRFLICTTAGGVACGVVNPRFFLIGGFCSIAALWYFRAIRLVRPGFWS